MRTVDIEYIGADRDKPPPDLDFEKLDNGQWVAFDVPATEAHKFIESSAYRKYNPNRKNDLDKVAGTDEFKGKL